MIKTKVPVRRVSAKPETSKVSSPAVTLSLEEANGLTSAWWKMESLTRIISHADSVFDGGQGVCDVWDHLQPIVESIQPFIDEINERRTQAEAEARTGGVH